ncbi:MAG: ABC transporter ATP-binding protein [Clostridia bacterium]|nr:ABC transporter ATP-binding protein [Clostridia bacterium]
MKNTLLKITDLNLFYQTEKAEIQAISNLNLMVNKGEFIAIIGPSGCGKTSILSVIAGLIEYEGKVEFFSCEDGSFRENLIGYMLQKDELFSHLTIEQNIFLPLKIKKIKDKKQKSKGINLLKKYGLYDFKNCYPSELSGGMRQRAALIRTLTFSPELLLLDEPFSALDYQTRLNVCDDVYSIIKKEAKTALLVTHDISEAISCADKILVLSQRPARVLYTHEINIDKSLSPLKRREHPNFSAWFEKLWGELNL